jgi:hypothetical protein
MCKDDSGTERTFPTLTFGIIWNLWNLLFFVCSHRRRCTVSVLCVLEVFFNHRLYCVCTICVFHVHRLLTSISSGFLWISSILYFFALDLFSRNSSLLHLVGDLSFLSLVSVVCRYLCFSIFLFDFLVFD